MDRREEEVEVADLLDRLRAMLVQGIGAGKEVRAALEPVQIAGTRAALALVFSELLQNALEHGGDSVRVELSRNGDVVLAIADDGSGIEGETDSGTGLSIVRALVQDELQGTLVLESNGPGLRGGRLPAVVAQARFGVVLWMGCPILSLSSTARRSARGKQRRRNRGAGGVCRGERRRPARLQHLLQRGRHAHDRRPGSPGLGVHGVAHEPRRPAVPEVHGFGRALARRLLRHAERGGARGDARGRGCSGTRRSSCTSSTQGSRGTASPRAPAASARPAAARARSGALPDRPPSRSGRSRPRAVRRQRRRRRIAAARASRRGRARGS